MTPNNDTEFLSTLSHPKSEYRNEDICNKYSNSSHNSPHRFLPRFQSWHHLISSEGTGTAHAECHTRTDDKDELPNLGPGLENFTWGSYQEDFQTVKNCKVLVLNQVEITSYMTPLGNTSESIRLTQTHQASRTVEPLAKMPTLLEPIEADLH